jgi:hypothetical protein
VHREVPLQVVPRLAQPLLQRAFAGGIQLREQDVALARARDWPGADVDGVREADGEEEVAGAVHREARGDAVPPPELAARGIELYAAETPPDPTVRAPEIYPDKNSSG